MQFFSTPKTYASKVAKGIHSYVRRKRRWGKILFVGTATLGIVVLVIGGLLGFIFLRHRQLCTYQDLVDQGTATTASETDLCPNLLDESSWGQAATNAFNPTVLSGIEATPIDLDALTIAPAVEGCDDQLNPVCWVSGSKPKLAKTDGFTNLLLVGVDSKPGRGEKNTDSIMVISLNHKTGKMMFISFPRDLYVGYYRTNGVYAHWKINGVYAIDGKDGLRYTIEQITGKQIHYYAYLNLDVFTKIIDRLGGVDIKLEEDFVDRYPCYDLPAGTNCPNPIWSLDGYYGKFTYSKGWHHFNSVDATIYTRSRKLSSDYSRAQRQQNLVKALMQEALNNKRPLSERLQLYIDFFNIFQSQVETNVGLKDIAGVFTLVDKISDNAVQIVADPNLGGGSLIYNAGIVSPVGWSTRFRDESYGAFRSHINKIWDNLAFYSDKPKILVVNASGDTIPKKASIRNILNNPSEFILVKKIVDDSFDVSGIRIYDFTGGLKRGSVNELQSQLPGSLVFDAELDEITQTDYKEDILIVWGKQLNN